jgi:dihydrofolate synthase / folylpolyglutamate synthase
MNFQETLEYMYRLLPMYQRVGNTAFKKDLTNTIKLLDLLGNPEKKFKSIHIAGTNGKGSSAHMLASIMQTAGQKTGLYTSPHLKRFTERIKIDGKEVDESFVCEFIEKLQKPIEEIRPSFFEITVVMAFDFFAKHNVDIAVIEVGLGGRFDSTNVIRPEISLITSISYDHMDMLGNTLAEIAFEKAGIIKERVPVVISVKQDEVMSVFMNKAREMQSEIFFADMEYKVSRNTEALDNFHYLVEHENQHFEIQSDLGGKYQIRNLPGVLKVVSLLNNQGYSIKPTHIEKGLKSVGSTTGFKGRWQKIGAQPLTICDTAHNEDGVRMLSAQIDEIRAEKLHIIWGSVEGKDIEKILRHLPETAFYYFCAPNIPRAMKTDTLMAHALKLGLHGQSYSDVNKALEAARERASADDFILVAGSNFIVAEINDL